MYESSVCALEINESKSRSISPITAARYREFFSGFSRRFVRRSHDGVIYNSAEDDSGSSSESSSFHQVQKDEFKSNLELYSDSSENSSSSTDNTDKVDFLSKRLYRRSLSVVRSALSDLSISPRSTSCQSTPAKKPNAAAKKDKKTQQKILRQPVSYTYLKGMSGLPTQRVPKSSVCCQYPCRRRLGQNRI
ncbi:unnamed protein product [Hermetia illucens]|uniref:DUF4797 domain-containing protein n=1 Tax=Hermetia illucens TaxID=343691 RepID=A0A7R8YRP5_HERIL|nr:uncharacterized protein LOC119649625 [Hermetia illucens]CAD7082681.1 unnamed protein product [Hermetia illucens]